jgi:hypothetical protein
MSPLPISVPSGWADRLVPPGLPLSENVQLIALGVAALMVLAAAVLIAVEVFGGSGK